MLCTLVDEGFYLIQLVAAWSNTIFSDFIAVSVKAKISSLRYCGVDDFAHKKRNVSSRIWLLKRQDEIKRAIQEIFLVNLRIVCFSSFNLTLLILYWPIFDDNRLNAKFKLKKTNWSVSTFSLLPDSLPSMLPLINPHFWRRNNLISSCF